MRLRQPPTPPPRPRDPAVVELIRLSLDGVGAADETAEAISRRVGSLETIERALARATQASVRAPTPVALRIVSILELARDRRRER